MMQNWPELIFLRMTSVIFAGDLSQETDRGKCFNSSKASCTLSYTT